MKNYAKVRVKTIKAEEFNIHLSYIDGCVRYFREPQEGELISTKVFTWKDKRGNIHLIYKSGKYKKVFHYKMDPILNEIDPLEDFKHNAGAHAMTSLKAKLKNNNETIKTDDQPKDINNWTWKPFTWYNTDKIGFDLKHVYQYDLNSAYLYYFTKPLPYGNVIAKNRDVGEGEIGFDINIDEVGRNCLNAVFHGRAELIFKTKIYKSFEDYVNCRRQEMSQIKDKIQKQAYKIRTYALHGNLKYHNIYISAAIVGYCKQRMISLKAHNKNIIMCTVDSLTSLGPIEGLEIGKNIGQFKIEHQDENFYYFSDSYKVWNDTDEYHKGLDKKRWGLPEQYYYDIERNRICCLNSMMNN